jgi:hypothetical protein
MDMLQSLSRYILLCCHVQLCASQWTAPHPKKLKNIYLKTRLHQAVPPRPIFNSFPVLVIASPSPQEVSGYCRSIKWLYYRDVGR